MTVRNRNTQSTEPRGWVDVYQAETDPLTGETEFQVYNWTEHHDSGAIVHTCNTRREAVLFAVAFATANNRKIASAEIIHFTRFRGLSNG